MEIVVFRKYGPVKKSESWKIGSDNIEVTFEKNALLKNFILIIVWPSKIYNPRTTFLSLTTILDLQFVVLYYRSNMVLIIYFSNKSFHLLDY